MKRYSLWIFIFLNVLLIGKVNAQNIEQLPEYKTVQNLKGNIKSIGSDTLANLMVMWAETFKQLYPSVQIQIQAAGSATAPLALIENMADLGPMSRKMKMVELQQFQSHFGYQPVAIPVAIDALSVYVHKDNPLRGLNLKQVDAIFSSNRACGLKKAIRYWRELGISNELAEQTIALYGRNPVSGTYAYFKNKALCKGRYRNDLKQMHGSAAIVEAISNNPAAIGYSGIGYKTDGVRVVPLSLTDNDAFVSASIDNIKSGKYPLARFLYIYINKRPGQPLASPQKEFIEFVLSREGQSLVIKDGYVPLSYNQIKHSLQILNTL